MLYLKKKVKSVIYLLFSYQTGYIMWHSRLTMYISFGCASGNIDPKPGMSHYIPCLIAEEHIIFQNGTIIELVMSCLLWRHRWMTFYAKPINRPLALEGWFEKPKNRLFGHVRVKMLCQNVCGDNRFFSTSFFMVPIRARVWVWVWVHRWRLHGDLFLKFLFDYCLFRVVVPSTYSPHRPGFISNERTCACTFP